MRSKLMLPLATALMFLATSCGLVGKEFTVKRSVSVHAKATDPLCQNDTLTFDLAADATFNELKGNLSKLELKSVTVKITNPKSDPSSVATKANGTLMVSASATADTVTLGTYKDLALTADATQELVYDQAAADKMLELGLNPPNSFIIKSSGCSDAVPAFFDFTVELKMKATI